MADGIDFSWLTDILGNSPDPATIAYPNFDPGFGVGFNTGDPGGTGAISGSGGPGDIQGIIPNGDGTFTDPMTGTVYDSNGQPTGDTAPGYTDPGGTSGYSGGPSGTSGSTPGSPSSGLGLPPGLMQALGGIPGIAGLLAPLLGGILSSNATNKATGQVVGALHDANQQITGLLGGPSLFAPYSGAGTTALGKLAGMNWKPLSSQFGPLGSGAGIKG